MIALAIIKVIADNLSTQAPLKKIQTNKTQPNFITPETKNILKLRDQALIKSKETKNDDNIRQFKTYRNLAHKLISKDKIKNTKDKFEKAQHNTKQLWQTTKDTIGWVKNSSPNTISHLGKTYHSPKKIADIINFTQISRNISLHRNTPKTETDPTKNYKKLVKDKNLKFEIQNLSMRQLTQQINEMKSTPSSGIDNVSLRTIKQIYPIFKKSILNLINTTINTGEYPQSLKCAKIIPILKQNKPENDPLSYRCVNILPSLAKIIDRTLNIQIIKHLTQNKLLLHQHFGGIQGRSTMTAVMTMLDDWVYSLEQGEDSVVLILDQSAAYNIVWHPLLIQKLQILGFQEKSLKLFKSYLSDRRPRVLVDSFLSDEAGYRSPVCLSGVHFVRDIIYNLYTRLSSHIPTGNPTNPRIYCGQITENNDICGRLQQQDLTNKGQRH